MITCPAEVSLVRISNDITLPVDKRRNYTGVGNALSRILKEEGVRGFFRGCGPFVNRAMIVGEFRWLNYRRIFIFCGSYMYPDL